MDTYSTTTLIEEHASIIPIAQTLNKCMNDNIELISSLHTLCE